MVGGGGSKIVATLRADCKVYPTAQGASIALANLVNYKIRTEGDLSHKSLSTLSVPTTVMDLGKQLLQYARDSNVKGVKTALSRGAPFTSDWLGMSALHFAAMNNQYEMCELLLEGGINKDSKTKVDRTPLHFACYHGNEEIVRLLISKNCSINAKDMLRMTPLHWAIQNRHKSVALFLLKSNADVTAVNKFGRTAMGLAVLTEQADLLAELKAASQAQANRKYNEQHEKETSEAVNSIMGLTKNELENKMDVNDDENTNQSEYAAARIEDLVNIKETGILGTSTINLLKSHGISMMSDDDTSKDMLNTVLQNGRQLILSEGGKLLLNETKKTQNNNNNSLDKMDYNKSFQKHISNTIMPTKPTYFTASSSSNVNKLKTSIISKAKDNQQMAKQNNIRIISLNDFKKLYSNKSLKTVPKILSTVTSHKGVVNVRQQTVQQPKQMKISLSGDSINHKSIQESMQVDEDDDTSQYVQLSVRDNDEEISEAEIQIQQQKQTNLIKMSSQPQQQQQQNQTMVKYPVRLVPSKRVEHMAPLPIRQANAGKVLKANPSNKAVSATTTTTVMPLLTTTEICRQLLELRKQNEELRRKFELAQKEKDEMRQRIERLEAIILVDKTESVYSN